MKEYNNSWNKSLVNPGFTMQEYTALDLSTWEKAIKNELKGDIEVIDISDQVKELMKAFENEVG